MYVVAAIPPLKIRIERMTERFIAVLESSINYPMVEKLRLLRSLNNDFMNKPVNNELFKSYAYCNENGNEGNKVKIINQYTSIFVAEAAAIRDCLGYIESNYSPGVFGIVSDSLSVITAIESKCNNYKRTMEF